MKFNFIASNRHYIDHMLPIWEVLPQQYMGFFYIHESLVNYIKNIKNVRMYNNITLKHDLKFFYNISSEKIYTITATYGDLELADIGKKNLILMEHGAGQMYNSCHPAWMRSNYNSNTVLLLATNEILAKRFKENNNIPVEIVGCPKLDDMIKEDYMKTNKIAISFHYNCPILPETQTTFKYYKDIIPKVAKEFKLLGHGHPVHWNFMEKYYKDNKIKAIKNFDQITKQADIYIVDNSSTLFEFAALGKPVIVLNCPAYRKDIEHGMRFWEFADIGLQVEKPEELIPVIYKTIKRDPQKERRIEIVKEIYPYLGESINRFINVITNFDY